MVVPLRVELQNENGIAVMNSQHDLGPDQFTDERFANLAIDVPVARLSPGSTS